MSNHENKPFARLKLHAEIERWPLLVPFRITGYTWEAIDVLVVSLETGGHVGRGEARGVYYRQDNAGSMLRQIEAVRAKIEAGISRESLQETLPAGGARNAVDCALWDLEAKIRGCAVSQIAQIRGVRPLLTVFTCIANAPEEVADSARSFTKARALKLNLTGAPIDADRVLAAREARRDVWLSVDANQGFDRNSLEQLMPTLVESNVALIEQPFPVGQEALLDGFHSPIPVAADESAQQLVDISTLVGRFDVVNIKLDKCGGLTEALAMVRAARRVGLDSMVGNMLGTSLAMAPAFLVGQLCSLVDLDGPVFLKADRAFSAQYMDGFIMCPDTVWGGAN